MKTLFRMLSLLTLASSVSAETLTVYFGTYTGRSGSEGIYQSQLNLETGTLSEPKLAARTRNPSFLEIHPDGRHLYAVGEGGGEGAVSAFAIDSRTGNLELLNQQSSEGNGPCHVTVDPRGKNVLVANYGSGSMGVIPIRSNGSLAKPSGKAQHTGSSVNEKRQKGPHAHSVNVSPDGRFAFCADLGIDRIMIYKLDTSSGRIEAANPAFAALAPGAGPRHFSFHPNGKFAYVINELNGTMTAFSYRAATGELTEIQTLSTLPEDFDAYNKCAEVRVHPNGKFLYGSNRGHNSIAVYRINPDDGKLTVVEFENAGIDTPRNFNIDPSGKFCLVANQATNEIIVFTIDAATGALEKTDHQVKVGSPVCIRFLAK